MTCLWTFLCLFRSSLFPASDLVFSFDTHLLHRIDYKTSELCLFWWCGVYIHWQNTPTPCLRGRFLLRFWPTRCVGFVRRLRGGYAVLFGADLFSPTAIALGPSAIVKVSGQNCFRTLYGSLGQIRLGLGHRWNWSQKPTRMPTQSLRRASIRGGCLSLGIKRDFLGLLAAATSLIT